MAADGGPPAPPPGSRGWRPGRGASLALLALGVLLLALLSPLIGSVPIPAPTVLALLVERLSGGAVAGAPCASSHVSPALCQAYGEIVWEGRVPEVVLGLLAGAALGMAGGTLQGLFRNPLADPFLLGLSGGGTLGAAIVLVLGVGVGEQNLVLPLFAFIGAAATGLLILAVARSRFGSLETLLLTGVAVANLISAILTLLLLYSPVSSLQVDFWLLGGLGEATWSADGIAFGVLLVGGTVLALYGRELNLLQLGAEIAQTAGVDSRRVRLVLILWASLLTAVAVAFTGIIGFVGLVSPHIVRRIAGTDYRIVLPGAAAAGAIFVVGARDLSLLVFPASVLPLGLFTAFAGVPFFLYLLYRSRGRSTFGGGG